METQAAHTEHLHALCAAAEVNFEQIEQALNNGANPNATMFVFSGVFSGNLTPLVVLVGKRGAGPTPALVQLFVDHGADIHWAEARNGTTALHAAAGAGQVRIVAALLELGADPNVLGTTHQKSSPLIASIHGFADACLPVVELLLERGASINLPGPDGYTAIFSAINRKNEPVLTYLLSAGADLNQHYPGTSIFGETAFSYAVAYWPEMIERLVAAGANPNAPTRGGVSCLWFPVFHEKLDVVARLLALGADINLGDDDGTTVLHRYAAATHRCTPLVATFLLENGANPNASAHNGRTALHAAVESQEVELVEVLLEYGANSELPDADGTTALQLATSPLVLAALGQRASLDTSDVIGLVMAFLRDGLVFEHEGWRWHCDGDELYESGRPHRARRRRLSDAHASEVLGYVLLNEEPALPAFEALVNAGLRRMSVCPLTPGEARERFVASGSDVLARVQLTVSPELGAEAVAEALLAGLTLSTGDKEGWTRCSAQADGTFLYEAGSHFGPEGAAHDVMSSEAFVTRWAGGLHAEHGRLEGYRRDDLGDALEHLGHVSLRHWLAERIAQTNTR